MTAETGLLKPGTNCWRIEHAGRAAFLVDGAAYFAAARAAMTRAQRSILILAWDIDSRMELVPGGADDGLPAPLGDFLDALAKRRRKLRIHVLDWDFAMLYAPDREVLPRYKLGWRSHRRVRFELDGCHPVGASHHQKVLVVDDAVAFVGGLDLTHCRWDTPAHRPDDPQRSHPSGDPCPPFHDVQMAVDGPAAAALGDLARERWRRATGKELEPPHAPDTDCWPETLAPDVEDVDIGIARTEPKHEDWPEVQEIKQLHLDVIAATRRQLYLENQYFSATSLAEAMAGRLAEPDGPEIALVTRSDDNSWLEEYTIGVMRARLHRRLRETAPAERYGTFYPDLGHPGGRYLNVHSKVVVMDDELLSIGSANLNNRSMGFDTECNLVLEARGEARVRRAIAGLRHRLLAEHLDAAVEDVARAERDTGSLLGTIETLGTGARRLAPLEPSLPDGVDAVIPKGEIIDPERPIEPAKLAARLLPGEKQASSFGRMLALGGLLAVFIALAMAWRWTELGEWLAPDRLAGLAETIKTLPGAPLLVLGTFVLGTLLVVPVTLMIAVAVLVFGPVEGGIYAALGSLLGAGVTYWLGQLFGRGTVRRIAGSRLDRLSRELGKRGVLAVTTVRVLPVAPFTIINLVAGATHISLRDFLLGTVLGMGPGIVAIALFIDRILATLRNPEPGTLGLLTVAVIVIVAGMAWLRRSLRRRRTSKQGGSSPG